MAGRAPIRIRRAAAYRRLAQAVVAGCVAVLKEPKPSRGGHAIRAWEQRRAPEIAFITNPAASAHWCETAGLPWDAVVSKLRAQGLVPA